MHLSCCLARLLTGGCKGKLYQASEHLQIIKTVRQHSAAWQGCLAKEPWGTCSILLNQEIAFPWRPTWGCCRM